MVRKIPDGSIETINDHLVTMTTDDGRVRVIIGYFSAAMTREEALRMAAWIVVMADDGTHPTFEEILQAVKST